MDPGFRPPRDERGVIVSWLAKLVAGFAVAGVLLFDAGAVVVNFFTLDSAARDLSNALTTDVSAGATLTLQQLEQEARAYLDDHAPDARLVRVTLDAQGRTVGVRLRRRAKTLILGRIGWTRRWTRATADSTSGYGR